LEKIKRGKIGGLGGVSLKCRKKDPSPPPLEGNKVGQKVTSLTKKTIFFGFINLSNNNKWGTPRPKQSGV